MPEDYTPQNIMVTGGAGASFGTELSGRLDWIGLGWPGGGCEADQRYFGSRRKTWQWLDSQSVGRSVDRSEVVQRLLFSVSLFVSFKHKFPAATAIQRLDSCVRCWVGLDWVGLGWPHKLVENNFIGRCHRPRKIFQLVVPFIHSSIHSSLTTNLTPPISLFCFPFGFTTTTTTTTNNNNNNRLHCFSRGHSALQKVPQLQDCRLW